MVRRSELGVMMLSRPLQLPRDVIDMIMRLWAQMTIRRGFFKWRLFRFSRYFRARREYYTLRQNNPFGFGPNNPSGAFIDLTLDD